MSSAQSKRAVLATLAAALAPAGFRRRGANFVREVGDVVQIIQLQSSRRSTADRAIVTVNLAVFSQILEAARGGQITAPTEADCHWRERLGFLTPAARDVWWEIDDDADATRVGAELHTAIVSHALPALAGLSSTNALAALWQSGVSPGLTDRQRRDYLAALATAPSEHPDRVA